MKHSRKLFAIVLLSLIYSTAQSNELKMREEINNNVASLFVNENFKELDRLAQQYRNPDERTASGLWKLTIFYGGFGKLMPSHIKDEGFWNHIKGISENWTKESPKSPTANIVRGIVLQSYAWKFRGDGWAKDVPEEAWKPFKDNLRIAKEQMLHTKGFSAVDPHWYVVTANILNQLGEETNSYKNFITESLDKWPNYYQLYFTAINYFAPKWHGSKQQIEAFANEAVERTRANEGMGMYARIYWYASYIQYYEKLFMESDVVWSRMKAGINDVVSKYPDQWNIQNFAYFSCLAGDRETALMLFDKMGGAVMDRVWPGKQYYDSCRAFAYSGRD